MNNQNDTKPETYVALDGSKHNSAEEAELATKLYWKRVLIPRSDRFQTTNNESLEILPELQITFYQNLFSILSLNAVNYNQWKKFYQLLKRKLEGNALTTELALLFANKLISAEACRNSVDEEISYQEEYGDLLGIIEKLNLPNDETRK